MNRSPPPSSNPLARSNPIASIKRDSVELDPLFDRESKVAQGQSTAADAADSPNSPLSPMRSSQAVDPVEALADEFLKNCS
ncbi:hypothetical protein EON64_10835 [archaeon]|nr:MAG: hypothetical protein EON64_10835 [archaeon]